MILIFTLNIISAQLNSTLFRQDSRSTLRTKLKTPCQVLTQRRRWDSNPRPLSESLVFKTSSLNHSDTSPKQCFNSLTGLLMLVKHFFSSAQFSSLFSHRQTAKIIISSSPSYVNIFLTLFFVFLNDDFTP